MSKRTIGFVLIALGTIIAVASLVVDVIGIGGNYGFGWKQQLGTAIGLIVAFGGVWLNLSELNQKK